MAFTFKLNTTNPCFFTITSNLSHDPLLKNASRTRFFTITNNFSHDTLLKNATRSRILGFKVSASSSSGSTAEVYEEGQLERPKWSGETPLSRLVGTLISIKPLFSVLKLGARQVFIRFFTITNNFSHDSLLKNATRSRVLGFKVSAPSSSTSSGSTAEVYEGGQLERPKWSGENPLSRFVGALISIKPLFSVLKLGARQVFISTAEKTNIPWREMTKEILDSDVYKELESIENPAIVYPDYYLNPFHAYDEGNLSWLAAAEVEAATMSMVRRAIPYASSLDEANQIVRGNWLDAIEKHHQQYSADFSIEDILDIGCSAGVSTGYIADRYPSAKVTGLDLSPYFLSVAQFKEKKRNQRKNPISWIHANGENTGLPSKSFDLVSIAYVFHECPERAIRNIVKESFRLLRPGGTIAITDNSPKSKILQKLPPVLFTLMKSTEPFLDEYYLTDLERVIKETGFANVQTVLTDPRHRTVTATVPY